MQENSEGIFIGKPGCLAKEIVMEVEKLIMAVLERIEVAAEGNIGKTEYTPFSNGEGEVRAGW